MISAHDPPVIPGWRLHNEDGTWFALRDHKLSEYVRRWGALDEVHARDRGELMVLCDAHTRLAERLATAEACHPKIEPIQPRT